MPRIQAASRALQAAACASTYSMARRFTCSTLHTWIGNINSQRSGTQWQQESQGGGPQCCFAMCSTLRGYKARGEWRVSGCSSVLRG